MLNKDQYINFGSSRIVFDNGDGYVIKYPLFSMGIQANQAEHKNYLKNPNIVAKTILLKNGLLLQEKLTECYEFSWDDVNSGKIEEMLIEKYGEESKKFFPCILNKKLCIGRTSEGILKQFDYENIKADDKALYMQKEPHLVFKKEMVDDYINFINKLGDSNINKHFYKEYKMGWDNPFATKKKAKRKE